MSCRCRRRKKTSGDISVISIGDDIDSTFDQQLSASIPIEHSRKIYPDEHGNIGVKVFATFSDSSSAAMPPTANDISPNFSSIITRCICSWRMDVLGMKGGGPRFPVGKDSFIPNFYG